MTETAQHIGIFGGSFNPPHLGHVLACHYALLRWPLDKVLVVPSYRHAFGKQLEKYEHRMAMCRLAFQHLDSRIEVSNVEDGRDGDSYTIDTVRLLKQDDPAAKFFLLVGGDIPAAFARWKESDALLELAPMLVIPRLSRGTVHGGTELDAALPDVNSTQLREAVQRGERPAGLPRLVLDYIAEHGLYGGDLII